MIPARLRPMCVSACACLLAAALSLSAFAQRSTQKKGAAAPAAAANDDLATGITTPKEFFGFNVGDDYQEINYTRAEAYWKKLATESNRMKLVDTGRTAEGRTQWMAIISSPENMRNLDHYKEINQRLARAENLTDAQAHALAAEGKAVVWIDGGLHSSESVGFQQLVETIYQLTSLNDPETLRFLHDDIVLCFAANPDGTEMVANWYMRNPIPTERTNAPGLPDLYNKYVGHDNNRDSFASNMPETQNMNRQLYIEWFPEILYNHHQSGPAGAVIFMPPFRDPFNYNFDPLIPVDIERVGAAMHARLIAAGLPGSEMRSGSTYSTWWDGGVRTTAYFHNMIGLLTEIIGEPTPMTIPLVPAKQLATGDWPMPVAPQPWHYRQSVDYEIQNNRAVLDYASRNRDELLYDIYEMGRNSIQRGSQDSWTITPDRIAALEAAAAAAAPSGRGRGRGGEVALEAGSADAPPNFAGGGRGGTVPVELYDKVLHDPAFRDPRVFIISADQPDFATATKFINALLYNGIEVDRATAPFQADGKTYPTGSFVVKTAQASRPFILDMFQPQNYPNDFRYPGGPPIPPYDMAGWTLAYQMNVQFDRLYDAVNGPFEQLPYRALPMPTYTVSPADQPAGYLISHQVNNSFIEVNRLLKAGCDVYWVAAAQQADGKSLGTGTVWVPAAAQCTPIVNQSAAQLGVPAYAVASAPAGAAYKLKPIRIGLYDQYGGSMPSGWVHWMFDSYEFPYELVYPPTLDAGNLKSKYDVLVFVDSGAGGMAPNGRGGRGGGGGGRGGASAAADTVPEPWRSEMGSMTAAKTLPALKEFVAQGGAVVTIGNSTAIARVLGVPVADYLSEMGPDGVERPLPQEKFYIPGSLMRITIDNTQPLAYGMPDSADVNFDSSPTFRLVPDPAVKTSTVAWYKGDHTLDSGWAWGQAYLDGGIAIVSADVGAGKVVAIGPEVTFRGQPDGTFKFLFNGLYYGSAEPTMLH